MTYSYRVKAKKTKNKKKPDKTIMLIVDCETLHKQWCPGTEGKVCYRGGHEVLSSSLHGIEHSGMLKVNGFGNS